MIYHCQCGATVYYGENTKPVCMDCRNNVCGSRATKLPLWVRAIRRLRTPEDRGVGDTVARIAAKFGGERFKRFSKRIGIPCGCTRRQAEWNERWPYDPACIVCGRPATTICSHTLSLGMCGEPLCGECTHRHVL